MNTFHLTPEKLLGAVVLPPEWAAAHVAFVCFTPFPNGFKPYVKQTAHERYFLHSPSSEVRLCQFGEIPFLVLSEVYGFAVGATTVEELVHYGIRHIIGVGYVGVFNGAPVGQRFIAIETMSDLPLAAHYGIKEFVRCGPTEDLYQLVNSCIADQNWGHYSVWTGISIYRESQQLVQQMKEQGCGVVNMDTLSIYAVTPVCAQDAQREVSCIYVGTVTDSMGNESEEWSSDLIEAVNRETVHPHDGLIKFMVEIVLPRLK
jgi:purine-nucleoside phosphorylase